MLPFLWENMVQVTRNPLGYEPGIYTSPLKTHFKDNVGRQCDLFIVHFQHKQQQVKELTLMSFIKFLSEWNGTNHTAVSFTNFFSLTWFCLSVVSLFCLTY